MLSSVALLIEINLCNLLVQMLFFSPWLNAITRGGHLYFIILLKLIEGSWMYKVLESVTLDTQHVISWMHLTTHELSLVLQKDGLGPSILSSHTSCFLEGFSALNTKRMFPFLCFVTRQHQPQMLDNAGSVCNQVCFGTCEQGSYIMTPTWTKEVLLYDHCRRYHGRGSSLLCCKGICLFIFLQLLIFNNFFFSKASERGGHPESATYSIILLLKLKIC